jgi:hypothetical protein
VATGGGGVATGGTGAVATGGGGVATGGTGAVATGGGGVATGGVSPCAVPEDIAEEDLITDLSLRPMSDLFQDGCTVYGVPNAKVSGPYDDASLHEMLGCDESVTFDIDFATQAVVLVESIVYPEWVQFSIVWAALDGTTLRLVYGETPYCGSVNPVISFLGYIIVPAGATELDTFDCNTQTCNY